MATSKKPKDTYDPIADEKIREALARPVEERERQRPVAQTPVEELPRWAIKPTPPRGGRRLRSQQ